VTETFNGQVIFEGAVEAFDLDGHPKAKRSYAFYIMESDEPIFQTVLELPPVDSPRAAVKVAIAAKAKQAQ
jgi:hypothetical protein